MEAAKYEESYNLLRPYSYLILAVLVIILYPSFPNEDFGDSMAQAMGKYPPNDWHPPLTAFIISLYASIWVSAYPFFLLFAFPAMQGLLRYTAFLRTRFGGELPLVVVVVLLLLSSMFIHYLLAFDCKDVIDASLYCLVSSLIVSRAYRLKYISLSYLVGLCSILLIGMLAKHISIIVCMPIVFSACFLKSKANLGRGLLWFAGMMIAIYLAIFFVKTQIYGDIEKKHIEGQIFVIDMAGISYYANEDMFNGLAGSDFLQRNKDICHKVGFGNFPPGGLCQDILYNLTGSGMGMDQMVKLEIAAIIKHPMAYLKHRYYYYLDFLGYGEDSFALYPDPTTFSQSSPKHPLFTAWGDMCKDVITPTLALKGLTRYAHLLISTVCRPLFMLLVSALGLIWLGYRLQNSQSEERVLKVILFCILLSSFINQTAFFVAGPGVTYRYILWTMFVHIGVVSYCLLAIIYRIRSSIIGSSR